MANGVGAAAVAPGRLQEYTGYLLRRAYVKAVGAARACLPEDQPAREAAVLTILDEHGALSQRELSDITHVNPTLIVKLVDALEDKGWVRRERRPTDRRSYALALTTAGRKALRQLTADLDRGEEELTSSLSDSEAAELRALLVRLLAGDPATMVGALVGRTSYLIAHAHRQQRERAEKMLAPLGLHPRDFGALSALAESQPCSQNALATRLGVTPPAALGLLEDLERAGLVSRSRNPDDRRLHDVALTAQGREALTAARRLAAKAQDSVIEALGPAGDERLRALLAKLLA